jgi:hypothetical protein
MLVAARRDRALLLTLDGGLQEAARNASVDRQIWTEPTSRTDIENRYFLVSQNSPLTRAMKV